MSNGVEELMEERELSLDRYPFEVALQLLWIQNPDYRNRSMPVDPVLCIMRLQELRKVGKLSAAGYVSVLETLSFITKCSSLVIVSYNADGKEMLYQLNDFAIQLVLFNWKKEEGKKLAAIVAGSREEAIDLYCWVKRRMSE